ncbi:hypothetical protein GW755_00030 [bacterium]|nr:hypothetical protein [bacterium]
MKNLILTSLIALGFLVTTSAVSARQVCFTQYGGGETCVNVEDNSDLDVEKLVSKEDISDSYKDHLKSSEHMFNAEDYVYFRIKVKNKGDVDLKDVKVKDVLPNFVKYDKTLTDQDSDVNGNEVTYNIGSLNVGNDVVIKVRTKVVEEADLPADDKVCITNVAEAKGYRKDNNKKESDSGYANFCIDLPAVLGTPTQLPKAGPESTLALIGALVLSTGVIYNRKVVKSVK